MPVILTFDIVMHSQQYYVYFSKAFVQSLKRSLFMSGSGNSLKYCFKEPSREQSEVCYHGTNQVWEHKCVYFAIHDINAVVFIDTIIIIIINAIIDIIIKKQIISQGIQTSNCMDVIIFRRIGQRICRHVWIKGWLKENIYFIKFMLLD